MSSQPSQASPPSYPPSRLPSRPNLTGVAAACILSGGLITAAIINSHRPVFAPSGSVGAMLARATPPIAQDSARQQFEAQTMNQTLAPEHGGQNETPPDFDYKGVKVKEVDYSAKDDSFTFIFTPLWQVKPGTDAKGLPDNPYSITTATATNDGYGHYTGSANLGGSYGDDRRDVDFTIR